MGQWLNWLPRINSSGGRANSFFFFFFFFDTRAKILGEEGGGGGWSDFHVNGSWYRRLYGKERGYGLYSIENTRGKSIVASARFVDPWACAPCAAYIGIRDGWIHPLRRKWRCTMMGDVFYDRVYLFKVFFFFFRKKRQSSYSAEDFSLLGFEIWRTTVSEQFFYVRVIVALLSRYWRKNCRHVSTINIESLERKTFRSFLFLNKTFFLHCSTSSKMTKSIDRDLPSSKIRLFEPNLT